MTKDNEINKILDRAEKYRKQLHSTETTPQSSSSEDNLEFEKIFKDFFGNKTDNNWLNKIYSFAIMRKNRRIK